MNLSGQQRTGKTQIVPCNYLTIDLADEPFKGQKIKIHQHRITELLGGKRNFLKPPSPIPHSSMSSWNRLSRTISS